MRDLTATGSALLAGRPVTVGQTAHEHIRTTDPIERLRILSDLTSNVSLNAARTIAANADHSLSGLIVIQIALGVAGLSVSLLLALALVAATRRRTAHFRSIVLGVDRSRARLRRGRLPLRERLGHGDGRRGCGRDAGR